MPEAKAHKVYGPKLKKVPPGTKVNPNGDLTPIKAAALAKTKNLEPDQVYRCAAMGLTMPEAAGVLGMHPSTFRQKLQKDELGGAWVSGQSNMRRDIRTAQYQSGIDDRNPTMLIWLGKQYLGQKDRDVAVPSITIEDSDKTISIRWDDELEKEYQDVLSMEKGNEIIDVQATYEADGEATSASGTEPSANADT